MSEYLKDIFTKEEFEELLAAAEEGAVSGFDESFTHDMRVRYKLYGMKMFISDKQLDTLRRIAGE